MRVKLWYRATSYFLWKQTFSCFLHRLTQLHDTRLYLGHAYLILSAAYSAAAVFSQFLRLDVVRRTYPVSNKIQDSVKQSHHGGSGSGILIWSCTKTSVSKKHWLNVWSSQVGNWECRETNVMRRELLGAERSTDRQFDRQTDKEAWASHEKLIWGWKNEGGQWRLTMPPIMMGKRKQGTWRKDKGTVAGKAKSELGGEGTHALLNKRKHTGGRLPLKASSTWLWPGATGTVRITSSIFLPSSLPPAAFSASGLCPPQNFKCKQHESASNSSVRASAV